MNLSETLQLLDKLREVGVQRFKSPLLEIDLCKDTPATLHMADSNVKSPNTTNVVPQKLDTTAVVQPPHNAENTQKVQELIDLLKLKDEELVNRIFPAGA